MLCAQKIAARFPLATSIIINMLLNISLYFVYLNIFMIASLFFLFFLKNSLFIYLFFYVSNTSGGPGG